MFKWRHGFLKYAITRVDFYLALSDTVLGKQL